MPPATAAPRRLLYVVNEDFAFLLNRLPMARAARDAGFEVHVATHVNKDAKFIEAEGFILHDIPLRRGGLSPLAAIPTILALYRIERRIKPLILHHSGLQCCIYGSIAAIGSKIRQVNAITGLGYIFTSVNWRTRILKAAVGRLLPLLLNREVSTVLVQNPDDRKALLDLFLPHRRGICGIGISGDDQPDIVALIVQHPMCGDQGADAFVDQEAPGKAECDGAFRFR